MEANFQRALSLLLKHEGGFVNHPADPGGATNKGITLATFRQYVKKSGTVDDLKNISDAQVAEVYKRHYWNSVRADMMPSGVDYAVFDYVVNSGPGRAIKHLQRVLGVAEDGIIGQMTLAAVRAATPEQIINKLCDQRMAFLKGLPTWSTFGKGWTRRVSDVRTHALAMVMDDRLAANPPTPTPKPQTSPSATPAPGKGKGGLIGLIIAAIAAAAAIFFGITGD